MSKMKKVWVLLQCPECEGIFIAQLKPNKKREQPQNLFDLEPLPENLTCPYCGIKNDVYATHYPKVEI
jgi:rubredoxin